MHLYGGDVQDPATALPDDNFPASCGTTLTPEEKALAFLFFDLSSSTLKPELTQFLEQMGPVLGRMPNQIQIHGHTDARPFPAGARRTNWALSFERADTARDLLERAGVRPGQVTGVLAHGSTAPLLPDDPLAPANRADNRHRKSAKAVGAADAVAAVGAAEKAPAHTPHQMSLPPAPRSSTRTRRRRRPSQRPRAMSHRVGIST